MADVRNPDEFLPVTEESGLIVELGNWVLRNAIETASKWHHGRVARRQDRHQRVGAPTARSRASSSAFKSCCSEYRLPPRCIEFELTESVLQTGPATIETLRRLAVPRHCHCLGRFRHRILLARVPGTAAALAYQARSHFDCEYRHQRAFRGDHRRAHQAVRRSRSRGDRGRSRAPGTISLSGGKSRDAPAGLPDRTARRGGGGLAHQRHHPANHARFVAVDSATRSTSTIREASLGRARRHPLHPLIFELTAAAPTSVRFANADGQTTSVGRARLRSARRFSHTVRSGGAKLRSRKRLGRRIGRARPPRRRSKAEKLARERAARRADPMAWVRTLDPMSAGGWEFRAVGNDGSWATFSSTHQMKRSGQVVTVWLRQEYAEPQVGDGGPYSSVVEKAQYDCKKEQARDLLIIYYAPTTFKAASRPKKADAKTTPWNAIVPGTREELNFQWACARSCTGPPPSKYCRPAVFRGPRTGPPVSPPRRARIPARRSGPRKRNSRRAKGQRHRAGMARLQRDLAEALQLEQRPRNARELIVRE